jgi:uncharacterized protein (DUF2062 family)
VLDALTAIALPVLVVNDGCTDETGDILVAWSAQSPDDRLIVTHPVNRGKAAALRTGFDFAHQRGFTHALTIDTDGQHDPADAPALLELSRANPEALILGVRARAIDGYPVASRFGRGFRNAMIYLESGLHITDSQSGYRIYPLASILAMPEGAGRYAFETEILVRCGWAHVPVIETEISCVYEVPGGRVTHFRKWRDSAASVGMHARLLTRSFMPWRVPALGEPAARHPTGTLFARLVRWFSPMRAWRSVRNDHSERKRFAAALSLGVFIANLPLYGVQTVLSLLLARRLKLHPLAVVAGSHLSTPPVGPLLIAGAIAVGHFILHGEAIGLDDLDPGRFGYIALLKRVAIEWLIGSAVCGAALAFITFAIVQLLLKCLPEPTDGIGGQESPA